MELLFFAVVISQNILTKQNSTSAASLI